jgi:hypothetical protein
MDTKTLRNSLVLILALAIGAPAMAALTKSAKVPMFPEVTVPPPKPMDPKITAEVIDRAVNRKPSSDAPPVKASTDFEKLIRDPLLKATTPDLLDKVLADWAKLATDPAAASDVRYFAAQMALMRPLRSIVYRLRPLIEKKNKSVQSLAVTFLKTVAGNLRIYTPDQHWKAGFDYLTMPSDNEATNRPFNNVWEFQYELHRLIDPLHRAADLMAELVNRHDKLPFVWDKQTAYGSTSYMNNGHRTNDGSHRYDLDRYVGHYEAEIYAARSSLLWAAHSIYVFNSYYQEGMMEIVKEQGKLMGLDGFPGGSWIRDDFGVSSANRRRILCGERDGKPDLECKSGKVPSYQSRMEDRYAGYLAAGFKDLKLSMEDLQHAWNALQKGQSTPHAIMNPINFAGDRREGQARVDALVAMTKGPFTVESVPTGEKVTINLPAFYSKDTAPKDLKRLFATAHDQREDGKDVELTFKTKTGKSLSYRNYYRGRPTGWDEAYWDPYIDGANVATALRVLQQSWGGDYVLPFIDSLAW